MPFDSLFFHFLNDGSQQKRITLLASPMALWNPGKMRMVNEDFCCRAAKHRSCQLKVPLNNALRWSWAWRWLKRQDWWTDELATSSNRSWRWVDYHRFSAGHVIQCDGGLHHEMLAEQTAGVDTTILMRQVLPKNFRKIIAFERKHHFGKSCLIFSWFLHNRSFSCQLCDIIGAEALEQPAFRKDTWPWCIASLSERFHPKNL